MPDTVICRSDSDYLGYPIAFYWHEKRLEVIKILEQNRTPTGFSFSVRTEEFGIFKLAYDFHTDQWSVNQL